MPTTRCAGPSVRLTDRLGCRVARRAEVVGEGLEDLASEIWIGNVTDDPKLPAAERAEGDVNFEDTLEALRPSLAGSTECISDSQNSSSRRPQPIVRARSFERTPCKEMSM
jgi:hypothetical protein